MTLLSPFALALAVLAIPIVLMYMLKLRRRDFPVSSTLLWRRALDDVQANAPWQRLRSSLLLLLQLLALAALVLALAGPAYTHAHPFTGDLIVIIDQSYGMQAHDVQPSRFEVARETAHRLAADVNSGYVMSVIGMAAEPALAAAQSDDHAAVDRAINGLHDGMSTPNLTPALSLAASLARSGERTHLVILTSRDSGIDGLPIQMPFPVEIDRVGGRARDLAITAFHAAGVAGHTQAFLRVQNFGPALARSDLDLFAGRQLADVRPLAVPAGGVQDLFWTHLPPIDNVLRARLAIHDDVDVDKTGWALASSSGSRRVLLVSSGDYFLETALTLDPTAEVRQVDPAGYSPAMTAGVDLVVFEGFLPPTLPPLPTLILAPTRGAVGPLRLGPERPAGNLAPAALSGPAGPLLLRYVDLSDVHVAQARAVALPDWLHPVVTSGSLPLVAAGDNGGVPAILLTFDLQQSDWPLRVSFPILVQNMLRFLTPGPLVGATSVTSGERLVLFPGRHVREVEIVRPDGAVDHLRPPFPPFTDTLIAGVYTARELEGRRRAGSFVVNFFPQAARGSSSGPDVLRVGESTAGRRQLITAPVSIAWVFGLATLAILSLEWWCAFRR